MHTHCSVCESQYQRGKAMYQVLSRSTGATSVLWSLSCKAKTLMPKSYSQDCLMIHCPGSFCLVNSGGFVHLVTLGLLDVTLCDCQHCRISRLYRDDAQDKKQQCHAHHESKSVQTIIIVVIIIYLLLTNCSTTRQNFHLRDVGGGWGGL